MQVLLLKLLLQSSIVSMLLAVPHLDHAIFRTKRPRYIMRGELRTPTPPEDYCRKGLCPEGVNHIACNNPFWGPNCKKPRDGINVDNYKTWIVKLHNNVRNKVSTNKTFPQLPRARYLPDVQWDNELSILAMRITNFCNNPSISKCANTARFLNVANSSDFLKMNSKNLGVQRILEKQIYRWYRYYLVVNESFVHSFPSDASEKDYRLANIINQNVRYVGCGMLYQEIDRKYLYYLTCLYNEKPKPGQQLYEVDEKLKFIKNQST